MRHDEGRRAHLSGGGILRGLDQNRDQIASWEQKADGLRTKLEPVYEQVWGALNRADLRADRGGASAPLLVLAYPQITHATRYGACGLDFGPGEVRVANDLAAHLNAAIKAAVADARAKGFEVYFVSDTADVALPNHTVCDGSAAYFNGLVNLGDSESFHPNVSGYAAEGAAIIEWSGSVDPVPPTANPETARRAVGSFLDAFTSGSIDVDDIGSSAWTLFQDDSVRITGSGYAPGTVVQAELHSDPIPLGAFVADDDGRIDGTIRIPVDLPPGQHALTFSGLDPGGAFRQDTAAVSIVLPPPLWVVGALAGSVVLLVVAGWLGVVGGRARRRASRATG